MNEDVAIVDSYPLVGTKSDDMCRFLTGLAAFVTHRLSDSLHLCGRLSLTDHKILSHGSVNLTKVTDDNVAAFLFLNTFSDGFN